MKARDPLDGAPASAVPSYTPCTATSKQSGVRCKRRPIPGGFVCVMHGGKAPAVQLKAQARLMALQPKAIQILDRLLGRDEYPSVQIAAVKDVLDRTEGKARESVSVTGADGGPLEIIIRKPWAVDADR